MFVMKKIVSRFLFPLPLSLEFLLLGLFLLWFTRRQRAGKALVTAGVVLLLGFSNIFTSRALIHSLEHRYPPFTFSAMHSSPSSSNIRYIAVLGGWANNDPNVPITSHLTPDLMVRLIEGVRLQGEIPGSKLILSGSTNSAQAMTKMAEVLGVRVGDILLLSQPHDTEEESEQIAPLVGHHQFILVTSAAHMPRAMGLFRKSGMQPIAAPTDYLAPRHRLDSDDLFPDGYKLYMTQVAFYEYLGLAWEKLRGKM